MRKQIHKISKMINENNVRRNKWIVLAQGFFMGVFIMYATANSNRIALNGDNTLRTRINKNTIGAIDPDEFTDLVIPPKHFNIYNHSFPCISKSNSAARETKGRGGGLHYIKVHKTASSTLAYITTQIAHNHGSNCIYYNSHAAAYNFENFHNRTTNNEKRTFLFTFVREPTKRAISDFFFRSISQHRNDVNLFNFKHGCLRYDKRLNGLSGHQLAYISNDERLPEYTFWNEMISKEKVMRPSLLLERIDNVFSSYDFIGVTERLDESLVVLSFLLDLSLSDILNASSKYGKDGQYVGFQRNGLKQCVKVAKPELSSDIQEYIETAEWKARVAGDALLFKTANAALDNTIDEVIGREAFEKRLSEFQSLQNHMSECESKCKLCSNTGKFRVKSNDCKTCRERIYREWWS